MELLSGYMTVGWNNTASKSRWLVLSPNNCKLHVYKTEQDPFPIKSIDISHAVFLCDTEDDGGGNFCIRSGGENVRLEAGSTQRRNYWLNHLRKERRNFGGKRLYLVQHPELRDCFAQRGSMMNWPHAGLLSPAVVIQSDDVIDSPTSERVDTTEASPSTNHYLAPNSNNVSPQSPYTLSNLGKRIRHSFRERRRSYRQSGDAAHRRLDSGAKDCEGCKQLSSQVVVLQEDLKATEDEYEASRQVIEIFQAQVEVLTREKEVLLEAHNRVLARGENEMVGILQEKEVALASLEQQCRKLSMQEEQLESRLERLQNDTALYKELLQAKDKAIMELTNQLHDYRISSSERNTQSTQTDIIEEKLGDTHNKFLNEELLEVNQLLEESSHREEKLLIEASEWEARFYQTQSKYMLLLNELQSPESNQNSIQFRELITRLMGDSVTGSTPILRCSNKTYSVYGFQQEMSGSSSSTPGTQEISTNLQTQWDGIVTSLQSLQVQHISGLKQMIRSGIPYHLRGQVWKAVMECHIRSLPKHSEPDFYKTVFNLASQSRISPAAKQIETDLLRTLPNNKHYEGINADGIPKLRRVLLAFSIYNSDVGYCQGLNRIVAILLLFLSEEDAFWGLVYIVEKLMPSDYYGQQLTGAQIDQRVLKDLIAEKIPSFASHLAQYSVDISLVTFNWFLCIFVDSLPVDLFLRVWDAFLFEGSKVLFRYALSVLKIIEREILNQTDYVSILTTLKHSVENLTDVDGVTRIAFQDLNPFPMKIISQRRDHHRKCIKMEMEKLEAVRQEYQRKMMGSPSDTNGNKSRFF